VSHGDGPPSQGGDHLGKDSRQKVKNRRGRGELGS